MKKICIALASVFIILNLAWAGYYFLFWHSFQKCVGLNKNDHTYSKGTQDENYIVYVTDLSYLSLGKNLAVTRVHVGTGERSLDDGVYCNLTIWPRIMKEDEYGISLIEYKEGNVVDEHVYRFMVNKDHEIIEDVPQECMEYYNANKDQIDHVFQLAEETWGDMLD